MKKTHKKKSKVSYCFEKNGKNNKNDELRHRKVFTKNTKNINKNMYILVKSEKINFFHYFY